MKLSELQSRPATLAFTSRCDARHLATLALLWQSKGELPRSTSELVRLSIETFVEVLVTSGQISLVPTQEDAQEILGEMGLLGKGVQRRNLIEALAKEGNFSTMNSTITHHPSRLAHDSPEVLQAVKKLEESLAGPDGMEKFVKDKSFALKDIKDMLKSTPEIGGSNET